MICVLSATGQLGLPMVQQLAARGIPLRAVTRSPSGAEKLRRPGVEVVIGNIDDEEDLPCILRDTTQLYLCTPNEPNQLQLQNKVVDAAVRAGVRAIVKLSVFTAEEDELCHFSRLHWVNEQHIIKTGIPYTFLHPNTFMQSLGLLFGHEIKTQGTMSSAVGPDKTITMVDVRDVVDVSVAVLAKNVHKGETLLITGPAALSYGECARMISTRIGKSITYRHITEREAIRQLLRAGVSDWMMEGIKDLYRMYDRNDLNPLSTVTQEWTGRTPRTFSQFLDTYSHLFQ